MNGSKETEEFRLFPPLFLIRIVLSWIPFPGFDSEPLDMTGTSKMPAMQPIPIRTMNGNRLIAMLVWKIPVRNWVLTEPWPFKLPTGEDIIVPKGFVFDGASIPKIMRPVLSPTGLLLVPGLVHDYAYRYRHLELQPLSRKQTYGEEFSRWKWDMLFLQVANKVNGMRIINFLACFVLVLFGWFAWYGHRWREL